MEDDRSFYERRLHEELARAVLAGDDGLKALHRRWAMLYQDRLAQLGRRSQPSGNDRKEPRPARRARSHA